MEFDVIQLTSYPYSQEDFTFWERYLKHVPVNDEQKRRMILLEEDFAQLVGRILESTPKGDFQSTAIKKLAEAAFYAKKAIARETH